MLQIVAFFFRNCPAPKDTSKVTNGRYDVSLRPVHTNAFPFCSRVHTNTIENSERGFQYNHRSKAFCHYSPLQRMLSREISSL